MPKRIPLMIVLSADYQPQPGDHGLDQGVCMPVYALSSIPELLCLLGMGTESHDKSLRATVRSP